MILRTVATLFIVLALIHFYHPELFPPIWVALMSHKVKKWGTELVLLREYIQTAAGLFARSTCPLKNTWIRGAHYPTSSLGKIIKCKVHLHTKRKYKHDTPKFELQMLPPKEGQIGGYEWKNDEAFVHFRGKRFENEFVKDLNLGRITTEQLPFFESNLLPVLWNNEHQISRVSKEYELCTTNISEEACLYQFKHLFTVKQAQESYNNKGYLQIQNASDDWLLQEQVSFPYLISIETIHENQFENDKLQKIGDMIILATNAFARFFKLSKAKSKMSCVINTKKWCSRHCEVDVRMSYSIQIISMLRAQNYFTNVEFSNLKPIYKYHSYDIEEYRKIRKFERNFKHDLLEELKLISETEPISKCVRSFYIWFHVSTKSIHNMYMDPWISQL